MKPGLRSWPRPGKEFEAGARCSDRRDAGTVLPGSLIPGSSLLVRRSEGVATHSPVRFGRSVHRAHRVSRHQERRPHSRVQEEI